MIIIIIINVLNALERPKSKGNPKTGRFVRVKPTSQANLREWEMKNNFALKKKKNKGENKSVVDIIDWAQVNEGGGGEAFRKDSFCCEPQPAFSSSFLQARIFRLSRSSFFFSVFYYLAFRKTIKFFLSFSPSLAKSSRLLNHLPVLKGDRSHFSVFLSFRFLIDFLLSL